MVDYVVLDMEDSYAFVYQTNQFLSIGQIIIVNGNRCRVLTREKARR